VKITLSLSLLLSAAMRLAVGANIDASSFAPVVLLPIDGLGSDIPGVAVGDLDGDGKSDIVAIDGLGNKFWVFRNTSTSGILTAGSFAPRLEFPTPVGPTMTGLSSIALGDLDGDGKLDVVIPEAFGGRIFIFRNISTSDSIMFAPAVIFAGTIQDDTALANGGNPSVVIRDLDGDGKPEIVTDRVAVLRNTSTPGVIDASSFAPPVYFELSNNRISLAVDDLNGDGKPDVVVGARSDGLVFVLRNASTPGNIVLELQSVLSVGCCLETVAIADFNQDGKPDIVAARNPVFDPAPASNLSIFQNNSAAGDLSPASFTKIDFVAGEFYRIGVGDLNGDGKPDLIGNDISFDGGFHGIVSVLQNIIPAGAPITSSAFAPKVSFDQSGGTVVIGDLDGDGKPDMVLGDNRGQNVRVFRNTVGPAPDTTPPTITCPADIVIPCSANALVPVSFSVTAQDDSDPNPTVSYSKASGSGFPIGTTIVTCTASDSSGNQSSCSFTVTRATLSFTGFMEPIGGADSTGGSFANPLRTFKLKSTIPVKFTAACGGAAVVSGIHRLQLIKYSNQTTASDPIDATPTDAATTGDQFRLTGGQWQFNLDTKGTGMSIGIWLLRATLSDGSQHSAWIQIK
jgi:hypothetical protein